MPGLLAARIRRGAPTHGAAQGTGRAPHAGIRCAVALLSIVLLPLTWLHADRGHASSKTLVFFVARESPLRDVSRAELRKLYLRHSSMIGSHAAIPISQPTGASARAHFEDAVLSMTDAEVGRYWVDRRIRGESGPPRSIASLQVLLQVVAKLPGAVAYANASEIDASVRVLRIEGKDPSDPGYTLR